MQPSFSEQLRHQLGSTAPGTPFTEDVAAQIKAIKDEIAAKRLRAYSNIMQAFGIALQGDVDQTRRLVESARELIMSTDPWKTILGEEAIHTYLSSLQAMAEAFVPIAGSVEAAMFLDFELASEKQKQAKIMLKKAVKKFNEGIADSAFWKSMCIYLSKLIEIQACQFASEKALYTADFGTCARWFRKAAMLCDRIRDYLPTTASFEMVWPGQEGTILSQMLNTMLVQLGDQLPRQSRLLSQKARMVQQYAALATKPSWKMRLLFFALWLVSIAIVAAIAKWSAMEITSTQLLWWSALSAGVAAGLLELGEWLAFLRAKALQKAIQQPSSADEEIKE